MEKLYLLKNLILLFFSKLYFRKYLLGPTQFKFAFSKDFPWFTFLSARWTGSIHGKNVKERKK